MGENDQSQKDQSGRQPKTGKLPPLPATRKSAKKGKSTKKAEGRSRTPDPIPLSAPKPGEPAQAQQPPAGGLEEEGILTSRVPGWAGRFTGFFLALGVIAACAYLLSLVQEIVHPPNGSGDPDIAQLTKTAARFETKAANLEAKVAEQAATIAQFETKMAELEGFHQLQRYGNQAIAEGRRAALYKLHDYLANPSIQALKETANAEIIRVETYYLTTTRFRGFPDEMPISPEFDPVAEFSRILLDADSDWSKRAQAARMLGEMDRDIRAADALAKASNGDGNLYVVQESILAFSRITGFRTSGVFDSRSVSEWWAKNRPNFE